MSQNEYMRDCDVDRRVGNTEASQKKTACDGGFLCVFVCRAPESNWARLPLPKQIGLYHPPRLPKADVLEVGRWCGSIVGTHPLVSTPFLATDAQQDLARDCPCGVSPNSPDFRSVFLRKAPKNLGQRSTDELARLGALE